MPETRSFSCRAASSFLRVLLLVALSAFLAGCPPKPVSVNAPPPARPQAIEAGQSATAEFPTDGKWHDSGYLARPGDIIQFEPTGAAAHLSKGTVLVRIGSSMTQWVNPKSRQRVTDLGEIVFRVDPARLGPYGEETLQVRISNSKKKTD